MEFSADEDLEVEEAGGVEGEEVEEEGGELEDSQKDGDHDGVGET